MNVLHALMEGEEPSLNAGLLGGTKTTPPEISPAHFSLPPQGQTVVVINLSGVESGLTTPIRSPRPYSPISSFLPSSFMMTERSRPLSTMKVLSDFSFCLEARECHSAAPLLEER